jgi:hypothetical protein
MAQFILCGSIVASKDRDPDKIADIVFFAWFIKACRSLYHASTATGEADSRLNAGKPDQLGVLGRFSVKGPRDVSIFPYP